MNVQDVETNGDWDYEAVGQMGVTGATVLSKSEGLGFEVGRDISYTDRPDRVGVTVLSGMGGTRFSLSVHRARALANMILAALDETI